MNYPNKLTVNKNIAEAKFLSPEYYTSTKYFDNSINKIFLRSWQFVNHQSLPFYLLYILLHALKVYLVYLSLRMACR